MAEAQRRRTHCPRGHAYDAANTCYSYGRRHCLACAKEIRAAKAVGRPTRRDLVLAKIVETDGCWGWSGSRHAEGYGCYGSQLAHRAVYEYLVGEIPPGLTLDHLCRNRDCVNPAHLEPVTLAENVLRGESSPARNARKTHCPQGHPYDEANTHINPTSGWRSCRTCNRERQREGRLLR